MGREQSGGCLGMQQIFSKTLRRPGEISTRCPRTLRVLGALAGLLFSGLLHQSLQASDTSPPGTYSLNLTWTGSPSPEVVGYVVYYGLASGDYTSSIAVSNVTSVTVPDLVEGVTYYFAITAVSLDGMESDYSNEISYTQGIQNLQIAGLPGGPLVLTVTGTSGHTYDIEATPDFAAWTVIGTVTLGDGGSLNFTDTNAADFPQRFYRTRENP